MWRAALFAVAVTVGAPAAAQTLGTPSFGQGVNVPSLPIVVLDQEFLFSGSAFGRRIQRDLAQARESLSAENRRIEAALEEEERALTEARVTEDPAVFRALAEEFDTRVQDIRRAQDTKSRVLGQQLEAARALFSAQAGPMLEGLIRETGALLVLDRRNVVAAANQVDITELAISRIDALVGEGPGLSAALEALPEGAETAVVPEP